MHQTLRLRRLPSPLPVRRPRAAQRPLLRGLRAIFGGAITASILTAAVACDKRAEGEAPLRLQTSLAGKPTVLFLLFGDRTDPRLLPVATIGHGRVTPISLDANGWRTFDGLYFRPGAQMSVYQDGRLVGTATVRRGMWEGRDALYSLPGCRALRPLAAVTFPAAPDTLVALEMLATSDPLPAAPARGATNAADLDSARAVAARVAERGGFLRGGAEGLELTVHAIGTGATSRPTLVGSYMERNTASRHPRHLFVLADSAGSGGDYASSFMHVARDSSAEFRRLIDHVDLTGDGTDEIVLEGWRDRSDSYLMIMRWVNGKWSEAARGANSWCADEPKRH